MLFFEAKLGTLEVEPVCLSVCWLLSHPPQAPRRDGKNKIFRQMMMKGCFDTDEPC